MVKNILTFIFLYQISFAQTNSISNKAETSCGFELELVFVEGGIYSMDSNDGKNNEKHLNTIKVNNFLIGKYEVTVKQFSEFILDTNYKTDAEKTGMSKIMVLGIDLNNKESIYTTQKEGTTWRNNEYGESQNENKPVIHVSWNDANAYCEWLSKKKGKHFHLPSEAEWEFAAIGGNKSHQYIYAGSNEIKDIAWSINDAQQSGIETKICGTKKPNELGLFDMSGNVKEWCNDKYVEDYSNNTAVADSKEVKYAIRGGSFYSEPSQCKVNFRSNETSDYNDFQIGFRLVSN